MDVQAVVAEVPEGSEVLASWDNSDHTAASTDENASQSSRCSSPVPQSCSASRSNDSNTQNVSRDQRAENSARRKRPATSVLQQLLELHKEEAATAAKAAKKSRKLMKKGLKLQKESNHMQASMLQLMQQHFASK
ncbi:hypothetical protein HPB50_014904 [Hyalomma asiaticum]|uniref:Uncharacterized protein n=1 Tax=Hyalomma asiaticum TaxID=266040 RepID=A0ACB7RJH1_HYAAI|nr:hypothetical protein HPB50_014904 [Hyalomma asiaticum]